MEIPAENFHLNVQSEASMPAVLCVPDVSATDELLIMSCREAGRRDECISSRSDHKVLDKSLILP